MSNNFLKGFKHPYEACIFLLDQLETPLDISTIERANILKTVGCHRMTLHRAIKAIEVRQLLLLAETKVLPKKYNKLETKSVLRMAIILLKAHLSFIYYLFIKVAVKGGDVDPYDQNRLAVIEGYIGVKQEE